MLIRHKGRDDIRAKADRFDPQRPDYVLATFESGQTGSAEIAHCEVYLEYSEVWVDMSKAFVNNELVHDRAHTWFREAETQEEHDRGWFD